MNLRPNPALEKMRRGELVISFKLNLDGIRTVQVAGLYDLDMIWIDVEHVPNGTAQIEQQVLAARAAGKDVVVRVKKGCYSDFIHPLEMDASGVMVPHVMSAQEARDIVRMTKFHPVGRRPVDGGNADGAFCTVSFAEYSRFVNANRFVSIQIEDPEALDELDEIAATPGIDLLFFGPADFSHGAGLDCDLAHPQVIEARARVVAAAKKYGKLAGTTASVATVREYRALGYDWLNVGADVVGLTTYLQDLTDKLSALRH